MNPLTDALRRALAIAGKELRLFFQDKGQLVVLLVLPLLMGATIGSINNKGQQSGTPQLPVYLVNGDGGPYGSQLAETLRRIEVLGVEDLATVEEADHLLARGERLAAIVIPADFSQRIDAYEPTQVKVIIDPAQVQYASIVTGIVDEAISPTKLQGELSHGVRVVLQESGLVDTSDPAQVRASEAQGLGVIMTQLQAMREKPLLMVRGGSQEGIKRLATDNWFNLTIPMFAVFFAFFLVGAISGGLLEEREEGTLRRLLAAPIHRSHIIGGKAAAYTLLSVLQVGVLFAMGNAVFGMTFGQSPFAVLLVTVSMALCVVSLGMVVAALARSARQAHSVATVMGFVLAGLGGSIQIGLAPLYRSKGLLGMLSQLTPNAHALEAYRRLLVEGAGMAQVLPQIAILLGMAVLFFAVAIVRFRFE